MKRTGPVTIIAIGAGNRSNTYMEYAVRHPERLKVVGVVEPNDFRRNHVVNKFGLSDEFVFTDWREFLGKAKMADAVIVGTSDNMHFEPSLAAIEKEYHILLEKPIAQSIEECAEINRKAKEKGIIVGVCHVLRYHPFFVKMKELLNEGAVGEIINIRHEEAVGIDRMTHAYVRGIWKSKSDTNPLILSKSCHDIDLLSWMTERKCKRISSMGSLKWFKPQNAPEGSTERCLDCKVEQNCPYSAIDLYVRCKIWHRHFDIEDLDDDSAIKNILRTEDYGRCVYRAGNDVVDHQSSIMEMEGDIIVDFTINGITKESHRTTHIMGSKGELLGNESKLIYNNYITKEQTVFDFSHITGEPFHAGADLALIADFVTAIEKNGNYDLRVSLEKSIESHSIAFFAEQSRIERKTIILNITDNK